MMSEIEKYINELLSLIYKKSDMDQIIFDLSVFFEKINYSAVIKNSDSKKLERESKRELINSNLHGIESVILREYLQTLLNKVDLWLFEPAHFKLFISQLNDISKKTIYFKITTAIILSDNDLRNLSNKLTKRTQQKVVIDLAVDKSIIGGAVIKKDNYILDYSLKSKLHNLSTQWKKSIQQQYT